MAPVTKQEVESAVRQYWSVSAAKDAERQRNSYCDDAFIFTSSSKRLEVARLVSMRRGREYLASSTKLKVEIGNMEVALLGPDAAVSAYTLQFHAEQLPTEGTVAKSPEEHLSNARVTQVFLRSAEGVLRIVHEHISVPQ
jgi:ketosteroid isomerase-like protein